MKKLIALFAVGMLLRDKARRERLLNGARGLFARAKEMTGQRTDDTENTESSSSYTARNNGVGTSTYGTSTTY